MEIRKRRSIRMLGRQFDFNLIFLTPFFKRTLYYKLHAQNGGVKIKDDTTQIFVLCDHPLEIKLHDAIKDCCSAKISKAYAKERSKESV